ncbi:transposase [Parageobacillus thermoglucosidasius]|uniref:transposase n=1 Tax=Parageobacillus thermoglucosidasius TaxID=1426 RepID=UPI0021AB8D53|nr:transposase [Parageobacillus thermoglucosidasius]
MCCGPNQRIPYLFSFVLAKCFTQNFIHHLLPPYSPNFNLVERIWGWLKESVIANWFHANRKELRESIVSFLDYLAQFPEKVLQRIGQIAKSESIYIQNFQTILPIKNSIYFIVNPLRLDSSHLFIQ